MAELSNLASGHRIDDCGKRDLAVHRHPSRIGVDSRAACAAPKASATWGEDARQTRSRAVLRCRQRAGSLAGRVRPWRTPGEGRGDCTQRGVRKRTPHIGERFRAVGARGTCTTSVSGLSALPVRVPSHRGSRVSVLRSAVRTGIRRPARTRRKSRASPLSW